MTAADRLRAAMEAALCNCEAELEPHEIAHRRWCYALLRGPSVLRAVVPIVEELERDRERLRDALKEACDEYEYAAKYKGDYLTAKHEDAAVLARLRAAIDAAMKGERDGEG